MSIPPEPSPTLKEPSPATSPGAQGEGRADISKGDSRQQEEPAAPPSEPPVPSLEQPRESSPDPHSTAGENKAEPRPNRPEWVMAWATVGLLLVTLGNAMISRSQWLAMGRQTKAMEEANRLNKESVDHSKATAASNDSSTQESLRLTRQNLEATREALVFARQSNESAQRAWVVMSGIDPIDLSPGKEIQVAIELKNVGRSPAAIAESVVGALMAPGPFPKNPDYTYDSGEPSVATVGPDQRTFAALRIKPLPISTIDAIKAGQIKLYVYGRIHYTDIFKRSRHTLFCSFYIAPGRGLDVCASHNQWD